MKKLIFYMCIFLVVSIANAQQRPQYTQYIFNSYLLNPALSGIENYWDLKVGYRNQWQGLKGAPVTSYLSFNMPIGKKSLNENATSFPQEGDNPLSRSHLSEYAASPPHHGVGITAVFDKTGYLGRKDINLTYAYHLGIARQVNLALGVAGGVSNITFDASKVTYENDELSDPALQQNMDNQFKPDLSAGVWLYGPTYFAGVSAQQLLPQKLSFTKNSALSEGKKVAHYFITAGYKLFLGEDVVVIPSVMLKYVSPAPTSLDMNLKMAFRDKFWIGGSYRKDDAFGALAGFNLSHLLNVSYSYDFTSSALKSVNNGTHEIVLGFLLNNKYKVTCPQKTF